ncbi:MAG TPA: glycosyltransferase family 39 protein [Nocardioides sp.]|nr:glycosyltransferase family 39 protein [Nocardioides sp.]
MPRPHSSVSAGPGPVPGRRWSTAVALGLAMCLGLALRLHGLSAVPWDFHPTRQLYDALMARHFWTSLGGVPAPGTAAAVAATRPGIIEPPLVQGAAALLWRLQGHPDLMAIRLALAVIWVLAAVPMAAAASRLSSRLGGLAATVVWLFAPIGVLASRSFQPDSLMMSLLPVTLYLLLVRADRDTSRTHLAAVSAAAVTIFVKSTAGFVVVPLMVVLRSGREAPWWRDWRLAVDVGVAVLPAALWLVLGGPLGITANDSSDRFHPRLLTTAGFWRDWLTQASAAVGITGLVVIGVGLVLARGRLRAVLAAALGGYAATGLVLSYHYATHSYYHLPLLLALALGFASVATWVGERVRERRLVPVLTAGLLVVAWCVESVFLPSGSVLRHSAPTWDARIAAAQEAGARLGHSTDVVFVSDDYGGSAEWWGGLAGVAWPNTGDLYTERLRGAPVLTVPERLKSLSTGQRLSWVLVLDHDPAYEEPDLRTFLQQSGWQRVAGTGWQAYRIPASFTATGTGG